MKSNRFAQRKLRVVRLVVNLFYTALKWTRSVHVVSNGVSNPRPAFFLMVTMTGVGLGVK